MIAKYGNFPSGQLSYQKAMFEEGKKILKRRTKNEPRPHMCLVVTV